MKTLKKFIAELCMSKPNSFVVFAAVLRPPSMLVLSSPLRPGRMVRGGVVIKVEHLVEASASSVVVAADVRGHVPLRAAVQ